MVDGMRIAEKALGIGRLRSDCIGKKSLGLFAARSLSLKIFARGNIYRTKMCALSGPATDFTRATGQTC